MKAREFKQVSEIKHKQENLTLVDTYEPGLHLVEHSALEAEREKCKKLKAALEFYGDMSNWTSVTDGKKQYLFINKEKGDWEYIPNNEVMIQAGGKIARQALNTLDKIKETHQEECPTCEGMGFYVTEVEDESGIESIPGDCIFCDGTGILKEVK